MDPESTIVTADGVRLAYVEVGVPDGHPVLYFHGTPSCRLEATFGLDEAARRSGLRIIAPDRPGCGGSPFVRYRVPDTPRLMSGLLDALEIDRVALVGVSGGGRYAIAFAVHLPQRVHRLALIASTASSDVPGVRASWSRDDRLVYGLARRAPWLLRMYLIKLARDMRRDPTALLKLFNDLSPRDREVMSRPGMSQAFQQIVQEALRHGPRGVTHDYALEARPWGLDLSRVSMPVDVWHGQEDTVVSPAQSRILADAFPAADLHEVAGEGHVSLRMDRSAEVLERLG